MYDTGLKELGVTLSFLRADDRGVDEEEDLAMTNARKMLSTTVASQLPHAPSEDASGNEASDSVFYKGQPCEARYRSSFHYVPALIVGKQSSQNCYDVRFWDGSVEMNLPRSYIREPSMLSNPAIALGGYLANTMSGLDYSRTVTGDNCSISRDTSTEFTVAITPSVSLEKWSPLLVTIKASIAPTVGLGGSSLSPVFPGQLSIGSEISFYPVSEDLEFYGDGVPVTRCTVTGTNRP